MTAVWICVLVVGLATIAIKAAGPTTTTLIQTALTRTASPR